MANLVTKQAKKIIADPGFLAELMRNLPQSQDVTPDKPGYYWCLKSPQAIPEILTICLFDIERKTFLIGSATGCKFDDYQFDGPILPPARWTDGNGKRWPDEMCCHDK
jgi:hypothetical protein